MMKLIYLSQEAIDDIKINFNKYKKHFRDKGNEWFLDRFRKYDWMHESKVQCNDIKLNMDEDYNVSDRKNVEILYEALKDLSPVLANYAQTECQFRYCGTAIPFLTVRSTAR